MKRIISFVIIAITLFTVIGVHADTVISHKLEPGSPLYIQDKGSGIMEISGSASNTIINYIREDELTYVTYKDFEKILTLLDTSTIFYKVLVDKSGTTDEEVFLFRFSPVGSGGYRVVSFKHRALSFDGRTYGYAEFVRSIRKDGVLYIPIRRVLEYFSNEVTWNASDRSIEVKPLEIY